MAAGDGTLEKKKKKKVSSDRSSPTKNGKVSSDRPKKSSTSKSASKNMRDVKSSELTTKMPEVGKRIRVYRNGDAYHKGLSVGYSLFQMDSFLCFRT